MKFSVIIPTRNRPDVLKTAIKSVFEQKFDDFEIIVVNDGSDAQHNETYQALKNEFGANFKLLNLEPSLNGHGPSFVRNIGALNSEGQYLCFLDDDDLWIDDNHLSSAHTTLMQMEADIYLTNQLACFDNEIVSKEIWLNGLEKKLTATNKTKIDDVFQVSVIELLAIDGFAHLNTIITTKELYFKINGLDESIRYEEDWDFYLRLIDNAEKILFSPKFVSRHNIPNRNNSDNASTSMNENHKILFRLYSLNKIILFAHHVDVREFALKHKIYVLKHLSEKLYKNKNDKLACLYAKEVLLNGFNIKWFAFVIYLQMRVFLNF